MCTGGYWHFKVIKQMREDVAKKEEEQEQKVIKKAEN